MPDRLGGSGENHAIRIAVQLYMVDWIRGNTKARVPRVPRVLER